VIQVSDLTRVRILITRADSSHVEKNGDSNRLESRFSQNDSTPITINDSGLESE